MSERTRPIGQQNLPGAGKDVRPTDTHDLGTPAAGARPGHPYFKTKLDADVLSQAEVIDSVGAQADTPGRC